MTKIKSLSSIPKRPKYRLIGETLISQILNEKYPISSLLPTEKKICEEFQISRHTAREAMRYVEKTGLVERRQGSGTLVKRNKMPKKINHFINSVNDLLQFGQRTRFEIDVSDLISLNASLASLLDSKVGQDCIRVGGIRIEPHEHTPICYSNIYRIPHMDDVDEALKDKKTAIFAVVRALDDKNIGKIEQRIDACLMPAKLASALNTEPNTAAMKITRRYFDKSINDLILVAQSIYPAERFSFSSTLYPNE
jgi:DNA-binding GntR family transcriptional regulator